MLKHLIFLLITLTVALAGDLKFDVTFDSSTAWQLTGQDFAPYSKGVNGRTAGGMTQTFQWDKKFLTDESKNKKFFKFYTFAEGVDVLKAEAEDKFDCTLKATMDAWFTASYWLSAEKENWIGSYKWRHVRLSCTKEGGGDLVIDSDKLNHP